MTTPLFPGPGAFALPQAYRQEARLLEAAGRASWRDLAGLDDAALRRLAAHSPGSEARLIRLRGQARLVDGLALEPQQAALLLHAGIPDPAALAGADAEVLRRQIGRLQRRLLGHAAPVLDVATVRSWILRARRAGPGRSRN